MNVYDITNMRAAIRENTRYRTYGKMIDCYQQSLSSLQRQMDYKVILVVVAYTMINHMIFF